MEQTEKQIGDLFDRVVHEIVVVASGQQDIPPKNYLVFSRSEAEPWHVSFFYEDDLSMRGALESGCAYDLHNYTRKTLGNVNGLSALDTYIWFESLSGFDTDAVDLYADVVSSKLVRMSLGEASGNCGICGHDKDEHRLIGPLSESETPSSGWMVCSDESCNCFRTWDAIPNPETSI